MEVKATNSAGLESVATATFKYPRGPKGVRVRSLNIASGCNCDQGPSRVLELRDMSVQAEAVAGADIAFLQEVDRNVPRTGRVDQYSAILRQLEVRGWPMHGYFVRTRDLDGGEYGTAVLSKFPIRDPLQFEGDKGVIAVLTAVDGHIHRVIGIHLSPAGKEREAARVPAAKWVASIAANGVVPVIAGGDTNSDAGGEVRSILQAVLIDACPEESIGIDRIYWKGLPYSHGKCEPSWGERFPNISDHGALAVEFGSPAS